MSPLTCFLFAAILAPLGLGVYFVAFPITRERAGMAHRALGAAVCGIAALLLTTAGIFLVMAVQGIITLA